MPRRPIKPASCHLRCRDCFVYQSYHCEERPESEEDREKLPAECRNCSWARDEEGICWGSICAMRNCCQNCGLGYALQCRRHPCRKMFPATQDRD